MKYQIQSKKGHKIISINRRNAIRERCLNCSGWFPAEVRRCPIYDCKLFPFRHGTGKQDSVKRSKAIREYCIDCMNGQRGEVRKCTCPDCSLFPYRLSRVDKSFEITTEKNN